MRKEGGRGGYEWSRYGRMGGANFPDDFDKKHGNNFTECSLYSVVETRQQLHRVFTVL